MKLLTWDMKNCISSPTILFFCFYVLICSTTGCVEVVGCLRSEELVCWEHVPESVCSVTGQFLFLCSSIILLSSWCNILLSNAGQAWRADWLLLALWESTGEFDMLLSSLLASTYHNSWHLVCSWHSIHEFMQKLVVPFEMRGYQGIYNLERRVSSVLVAISSSSYFHLLLIYS